jgi:glucoamylase
MLAGGQTESALHALIWLACVQASDGSLPQNSWINGTAYWKNTQLDEVAAPILLAWRLHRADALRQFDPWALVSRAARYLMERGPVTAQERWEENSGYSPSTLAAIIAALVCAAEFARHRKENLVADFMLDYADWLSAHLEEWTVTNRGELVKDKPRHYVRITPADPQQAEATADPDNAVIEIANSGGKHPARNIVSGDFLQLVRLGVRAADDPLMVDSLVVIDQQLKRDLPQGPCWRRYNYDGYGQKADGSAFDGTGEGRSWPILTGERGHYELAAGRDPLPFIAALEKFANAGGMLAEQLWDADDLPDGSMKRGGPTGSAMPLCWSHAEYVSLVRSAHDSICFDRVEPAFQRYVANSVASRYEIWTLRHQLRRVPHGKILRIIVAAGATVVWSANDWTSTTKADMTDNNALSLWFADIPTENCPGGLVIAFTFFWKEAQRWEDRNYSVVVSEPK